MHVSTCHICNTCEAIVCCLCHQLGHCMMGNLTASLEHHVSLHAVALFCLQWALFKHPEALPRPGNTAPAPRICSHLLCSSDGVLCVAVKLCLSEDNQFSMLCCAVACCQERQSWLMLVLHIAQGYTASLTDSTMASGAADPSSLLHPHRHQDCREC